MNPRRVALMGPFSVRALAGFLPEETMRTLPPGAGGAALVNLAVARLQRQWPTDIITLDAAAPSGGIKIEQGPLRLWIMPRRPAKAMRDLFRQERMELHNALRASRADVCHAHWTYEYGLAAVTQSICPTVVTVHDHARRMLAWCGPRFFPLYVMSRRVLKSARHLTAVSPGTAAYAGRVAHTSVPVIANCLSPDTTTAPDPAVTPPAGRPLFVGAWSWAAYRNTKRGLRVFAAVRHRYPDARLDLMGVDMEANGPAARWAEANGLTDGVRFLGLPPWNETLARLLSADVVFHPSLEESFSLPVAEALARGVPVVAARQAAGPAWLVEQSGNGALVDGTDVDGLTTALIQCIEDRREKDTATGTERLRRLCDANTVLASYDRVYDDAIGRGKTGPT